MNPIKWLKAWNERLKDQKAWNERMLYWRLAQKYAPNPAGLTFRLTQEQVQKADEWVKLKMKEHNKTIFDYGAAGGGVSYIFTPTGLGMIEEVTEYFSGEKLSLTDFDSW